MSSEQIFRRSAFLRLALATTIATYLLIAVGALVRAAGAGLGCPDWPRCFGSWVPPTSAAELPPGFDASLFNPMHTWLEYVNRLVGVVIGLLIFATLIAAWRSFRRERHVVWPATLAFVLVGFQGWLGGQVVAKELAADVLTAHLVVALIIVGLLLHAYLSARFGGRAPAALPPGQRLVGRVGWAVGVLALVQAGLGTRVRSVLQELEKADVPRSQWMPLGWWPDIAHRQLAVLAVLACMGLLVAAWRLAPRHPGIRRWAEVSLGLAVAQIAVGLGLAYLAVPPALQVIHLALAALLVGALSVVIFQAYRVAPGDAPDAAPGVLHPAPHAG